MNIVVSLSCAGIFSWHLFPESKLRIGKLEDFKTPLSELIQALYLSGYTTLSVKDEHIETYNLIDFHDSHRDPFDRNLAAAAYFEKLAIITKDAKFQLYTNSIDIVW